MLQAKRQCCTARSKLRSVFQEVLKIVLHPLTTVLVCVILIASQCDVPEKRENIPPLQVWVEGLANEIPSKRTATISGVFGAFDTLHIVSQFTGATHSTFTTEDLTKRLKAHINEYLPNLTLVEGLVQTDAKLWLEVNLTAKSDGTIYGFTRIEFQRDISILKTNLISSWQVWEDLVTFDSNQNPIPDVYYNIELHTKKFCAFLILAMRNE